MHKTDTFLSVSLQKRYTENGCWVPTRTDESETEHCERNLNYNYKEVSSAGGSLNSSEKEKLLEPPSFSRQSNPFLRSSLN